MKILSVLALSVFLSFSSFAPEATPPWTSPVFVSAEALQRTAVTVVTERGSGSGVAVLGPAGAVIWTAFHVVDGAQNVRIVKQIQTPLRTVGFFSVEADVVGFSKEHDLAVLRPRKSDFFTHGAQFELSNYVPKVGESVTHVGSLFGVVNAESVSIGIVSYAGRVLSDGLAYFQVTCTAVPGSSGGPVFNSSGCVIGLVVSGFSETISFCVPIQRIRAWAVAEGHPEWLPNSP